MLLAITFAVDRHVDGANDGARLLARDLLLEALDTGGGKAVLIISTVGQLFCGIACLTSASRMCFAFSRDRGPARARRTLEGEPEGSRLRGDLDGRRSP